MCSQILKIWLDKEMSLWLCICLTQLMDDLYNVIFARAWAFYWSSGQVDSNSHLLPTIGSTIKAIFSSLANQTWIKDRKQRRSSKYLVSSIEVIWLNTSTSKYCSFTERGHDGNCSHPESDLLETDPGLAGGQRLVPAQLWHGWSSSLEFIISLGWIFLSFRTNAPRWIFLSIKTNAPSQAPHIKTSVLNFSWLGPIVFQLGLITFSVLT